MHLTHTKAGSFRIAALGLMCALVLRLPVAAQSRDEVRAPLQGADSAWNVTEARGRAYEVDFTTDEGTWMSVDVSPDGRWVVFDLLGHVYRMPSDGGEAEALTQSSGVATNYHPQYSPDAYRVRLGPGGTE